MGATHTFALLEVSERTFDEIEAKLRAAGYEQCFVEGALDMHGLGLIKEQPKPCARTIDLWDR